MPNLTNPVCMLLVWPLAPAAFAQVDGVMLIVSRMIFNHL